MKTWPLVDSFPDGIGVNRDFEASTAGGGAAVGAAELVFADDPKENRGLAGSVEVTEDEVAVDPELGKGTKVKGRGDGVDCGGAPVNGVATFGSSPNNEVVVLCGAEELAVDALAMLGSNNGFGIGGFPSVASPVATSENDKLVVAEGFSCTVDFPNKSGRLEVPLVLVVAVAVDAG